MPVDTNFGRHLLRGRKRAVAVERAAVSGTTLSNDTLPAWRNVRGRLSPERFPLPPSPCQTNRMKRLTATICLTIAVLLGSGVLGLQSEHLQK
jgi:hypothetical protein